MAGQENEGEIFVIKASGEREQFSREKLLNSLNRAGASPDVAEKIASQIEKGVKSGTRVSDIYHTAFSLLHKLERGAAGRYSLKMAIMALGPTGHPFERLVGEILEAEGFSVEVGQIAQGACVEHEVDVVARKGDRRIMVECKFHNEQGIRTDVKVALYVQARFEDIEKKHAVEPNYVQKFHEAWLITNTKLTSSAIRYASCAGLTAIGWNYPANRSLQNLIEQSDLHPLTCLTTLSEAQKRQLLDAGLVLCGDIAEREDALSLLGLNDKEIREVRQEVSNVCEKAAFSPIPAKGLKQ